jgi:hypothetical protein
MTLCNHDSLAYPKVGPSLFTLLLWLPYQVELISLSSTSCTTTQEVNSTVVELVMTHSQKNQLDALFGSVSTHKGKIISAKLGTKFL